MLYDTSKLELWKFADSKTRNRLVKMASNIKFDGLSGGNFPGVMITTTRLISRVNKDLARVRLFKTPLEAVSYLKAVQSYAAPKPKA